MSPCDVSSVAQEGHTLLEVAAVLAFATVAVLASLSTLQSLSRQARIETARQGLMRALVQARRLAYTSGHRVDLSSQPGEPRLVVSTGDYANHSGNGGSATATIELPPGAYVVDAPSDGVVSFFASGLAENATITVNAGCEGCETKVVVNQRSGLR